MINNYDKIARYYDSLSRFVFFKSQVNAQIRQLKYLPADSSILIVGGGTGWILEEIAKVYSSGLRITYIEISAKMIALSKARQTGDNNVEFINAGVETYSSQTGFDVIVTPFLFDNFSEVRAKMVFDKLDALLLDQGLWFFTDFSLEQKKGKLWKSILLNGMYLFFKVLKIVEASKLPDMESYFEQALYHKVYRHFHYGGFIQSSIYQKKAK